MFKELKETNWEKIIAFPIETFVIGIIPALLFLINGNLLLVVRIHTLMNTPTLLIEDPFDAGSIRYILSLFVLIFWPKISSLLKINNKEI